jgi:hypothetical protein
MSPPRRRWCSRRGRAQRASATGSSTTDRQIRRTSSLTDQFPLGPDGARCFRPSLPELVVDAAADEIVRELESSARNIWAREINIEILDLGRPVRGESVFDAPAGGPARHRRAAPGNCRGGEGGAACPVEQNAVQRPTCAAAHRRQPVAFEAIVIRAVVIAIAFEADDERSHLIVAAQRAAAEEAIGGDIAATCRRNGAEIVAAVDTEIDAGPAERKGSGLVVGREPFRLPHNEADFETR